MPDDPGAPLPLVPEEPVAPVDPELPPVPGEPAPEESVPGVPDAPLVAGAELAPEPMSDDDPDIDPDPLWSGDVQAIRKTHAKGIIHLIIKTP